MPHLYAEPRHDPDQVIDTDREALWDAFLLFFIVFPGNFHLLGSACVVVIVVVKIGGMEHEAQELLQGTLAM